MGFETYVRTTIRSGDLSVSLPGGRKIRLGDGAGPPLAVTIHDTATVAKIAANPGLALGEAYMDGRLSLEQGDIYALLALAGANFANRPGRQRAGKLGRVWRDLRQHLNDRTASRRNVHLHYDLSVDLYRRFLDEDLQYSCAYFTDPDMSLEAAQVAKKRHLAAKLRLTPGKRLLDIGCGWGGLGLTLAGDYGVNVHGVTLATEQLALAQARAAAADLEDRAQFSLTDYRDVAGPFDRIVSVGMFEHVGRPNYQTYFDTIARLLTDDGVAVVHSIGRSEGPNTTQAWVAKYIFPGGYIPALSEVMPMIERSGLIVTDIEILRLHYAETVRHWRARFQRSRAEIAQLYDERFCRMWEFYLAASEVSFRFSNHMVFQLQLTKRIDAVPITRDYIAEAERTEPQPHEHRQSA
jgi:cyclopropane-fatty-acyl-phospholipid synthase